MTETLRRTFGTDISNIPRRALFPKKSNLAIPSIESVSPIKTNFSPKIKVQTPLAQQKTYSPRNLETSWRVKTEITDSPYSPQTTLKHVFATPTPRTPLQSSKTPQKNRLSLTPQTKTKVAPPAPTTVAPFAIESKFHYSTEFLMAFQHVIKFFKFFFFFFQSTNFFLLFSFFSIV